MNGKPIAPLSRFTVAALLAPLTAPVASEYHLSPSGDDARTGTPSATACKTLERVNRQALQPGDSLLFESGGTWQGQLRPQGSGVEGKPIRFGRYGDGSIRGHRLHAQRPAAGYASVFSREQQGHYLARQFLVNLSLGIPVSIWYDWRNDGADPQNLEHNFGTVTFDHQSKPAYVAMQKLAQALGGMRFVKRLDAPPDE
jgi:hypothetical protein